MPRFRRLLALPLLLACGAAQEPAPAPSDWALLADPRQGMTAAVLETTAGVHIILRCHEGAFTAFVTGLAPSRRETRRIELTVGDGPRQGREWANSEDGTSAFSDLPAPLARELRNGGQLQLRVPPAESGEPATRYVLEVAPSQTAIDQTLTACGLPLVDPRDQRLADLGDTDMPRSLDWSQRPRITFPASRYARGFAVVSCITAPDGRPTDCVIETEHPHDGGFGRAVLRGVERGRIGDSANPDSPLPPLMFVFRSNFVMEGYATREDNERIREQRRQRREERRPLRGGAGEN